jgi:hypothetical protein
MVLSVLKYIIPFVKQYPGKVPALNATKVLNGRDQYGMKGVF